MHRNFNNKLILSCMVIALVAALSFCGKRRITNEAVQEQDDVVVIVASGTTCNDSSDCEAREDGLIEYCRFAPGTVLGGTGTCDVPCIDTCDNEQVCQSGECSSSCTGPSDCPLGKRCDIDSGYCAPGLTICDGDNDCGNGRVCIASQCQEIECDESIPCPAGQVCNNNSCEEEVVNTSCQADLSCGSTQFCNLTTNACEEAQSCNDHPDCQGNTAGNVVCDSNVCRNPRSCVNGACPDVMNTICDTVTQQCLPVGADCTIENEAQVCDQGQYCEPFSQRCTPGCRDDVDCAGDLRCDLATRECSDIGGSEGEECTISEDCLGGFACVYRDSNAGLLCGFGDVLPPDLGGDLFDCTRECRRVCGLGDVLIDTCPEGTSCNVFDINNIFGTIFGGANGEEAAPSVCTPDE